MPFIICMSDCLNVHNIEKVCTSLSGIYCICDSMRSQVSILTKQPMKGDKGKMSGILKRDTMLIKISRQIDNTKFVFARKIFIKN